MKKLLTGILAIAGVLPTFANAASQTVKVEVTSAGFVPNSIDVKPGTELTLEVTRKTDETCSKEVQVPSRGIKKTALPLGKSVSIPLGKLEKGEIKFGCGMNMMESGKILVH